MLESELLGVEASHDLDPTHVLIELTGLGITGYQAADWLREHRRIDMGLSDHRRVEATLSMADDEQSIDRLLDGLRGLVAAAPSLPAAKEVRVPDEGALQLEPAMLPRDAFFAATDTVPVAHAVGRICAEQITPYPPGIPALIPGERITDEVIEYLRTGLAAGMVLPDPADPSLDTIRVVAN